MAQSWRTTALAQRHEALGSKLEDWIGMPTAWTYEGPVADSYVAIRTKAGLMDVSGLKKLHLNGPHASGILDMIATRDVGKITPGRSAYTTFLNDSGKFIEDGILYRMGPNSWMVVHGGGAGHELLAEACFGRNVSLLFDDDLHDLSLQGPVAVDLLERFVPGVRALKYFHHMPATLFGRPVTLSRTGYTGERGYEIFCSSKDVVAIWDAILAEGAPLGIVPAAFTALDLLRVESYLLFYPFDMSEIFPFEDGQPAGDTLWELGLDFTVSPGKTGFRGADAHWRARGQERFRMFGVLLDGETVAQAGEAVWAGGQKAGVITMGMYSPLSQRSMALARLSLAAAVAGTALEVRTAGGPVPAVAHALPFYDPDKGRRTAVG